MVDIKGYEFEYAITSCGKVYSYKSKKFLKEQYTRDGYQVVILSKDGVRKNYRINRLVAEAYIPNPEGKPQVGHLDDVKEHNYISNLYWTDAKENNNHGAHNERISRVMSKPVLCVETGIVYPSAKIAAELLGIDSSYIGKCCRNPNLTCGKCHWQYANI